MIEFISKNEVTFLSISLADGSRLYETIFFAAVEK